ncbi:patatin-like phospholipase family protein [Roseomonas sp. HJA6]|uniref:Patatin-like phospholipase family protein n=1 Tax=Roseomonas alba TaxID=2846776 RepID=A0ABS7A989_9PROT|nr:patatin-like phospholipase family protein [Neoroseomonas alba]MBW6398868.1 patatin-like phospholipase family protein [Neoroseomonas alba]
MLTTPDTRRHAVIDRTQLGQIVLVLQGGGALGAYQAGVYQALDEAGIEPDWVIGTSIGAINAAIIAGNRPDQRLPRLREFWSRMQRDPVAEFVCRMPGWGAAAANAMTVLGGLPAFFKPNPLAALGLTLEPETAGYYSTAPLEKTLDEVIDTEILSACTTRLTVGAANVRTAQMRYFDSRDMPVSIRHVMASGALPPAFPAVRIDGELYWDGGILSNTPVEAVFDDAPRRSGLVFTVNIWHPEGPEPDDMIKVMARQKDVQYASRAKSQVERQKQIHRLRHIIAELAQRLPEETKADPEIRHMTAYGCLTRMHVVRLQAPAVVGEDHTKDIDFSARGIRERWEAGYADTIRVLDQQPWTHQFDPLEGFILHETEAGTILSEG